MGTWACPNTREQMDRLERLMALPIPASHAADAFSGLLGDDDLFDTIGMAEDRNPSADIRPLVALTLELWGNWTPDVNFTDGRTWDVAERARRIAQEYVDFDLTKLIDLKVGSDDDVRVVMERLKGPGDYDVMAGGAPGVRVVRSAGEIYRVEPVWGAVLAAPPAMREGIEVRYPAQASTNVLPFGRR